MELLIICHRGIHFTGNHGISQKCIYISVNNMLQVICMVTLTIHFLLGVYIHYVVSLSAFFNKSIIYRSKMFYSDSKDGNELTIINLYTASPLSSLLLYIVLRKVILLPTEHFVPLLQEWTCLFFHQ